MISYFFVAASWSAGASVAAARPQLVCGIPGSYFCCALTQQPLPPVIITIHHLPPHTDRLVVPRNVFRNRRVPQQDNVKSTIAPDHLNPFAVMVSTSTEVKALLISRNLSTGFYVGNR